MEFCCNYKAERSTLSALKKRRMVKKLFFGMLALGLIAIPVAGAVYASENESKPWENLRQFRGGFTESAKNQDLGKEDFFALRNTSREAHREARLEQRMARLADAVERGCLDPEELEDRMQMRGWRFAE